MDSELIIKLRKEVISILNDGDYLGNEYVFVNSKHEKDIFSNKNIVIFQPGKVGSVSIHKALVKLCQEDIIKSSWHTHYLWKNALRFDLKEIIDLPRNHMRRIAWCLSYAINNENLIQNINFIIVVREPISRILSAVWQNLGIEIDLDNRIVSSEGKLNLEELRKFIVNEWYKYPKGRFAWHETQFKNYFGFDLSNLEINKKKGYGITETKYGKILFLKYEKLNEVFSQAIKCFLNISNVQLSRENVGDEKPKGKSYSEAKKTFKLQRTFLEQVYNMPFVIKTYSLEEIQKYTGRWSE